MAEEQEGEGINPWIVLAVVMVGTFMSILDTTIMNVALPRIMTTFGSTVEHVKWVSTGFMIAAAITMPISGWMGQKFGHGLTYLFALGLFSAGAALSAMSWSLDSLIFSRLVQGMGAGIVQPTSVSLLTQYFPPHIRGRVFGIWSIGVMTAPTLGPTTGGFLLEFFNWRAIFTMSLLVGVAALLFAMAILSRERTEEGRPFDFPGYFTLAIFLCVGLITVSNGQQEGWGSRLILLGATISVVSFLLFLVVEWDEPHPIVPLRLFRIPDFTLAMMLTSFRSLGLFGAVFLMPIFLQQVQGRDSIQVGLMLMPGAISMAVSSPGVGWLTDKFGGRWPTVIGISVMSLSLLAYYDIDPRMGIWAIVWPQAFRGLGIAFVMTPVVTTGMNSVAKEDAGHASWMLNLAQRVGGAFSISILSTLLFRQTIQQRELIGDSALLRQTPSHDFQTQALASGLAPHEIIPFSKAVAGQVVSQAAMSRAFQNLFMVAGFSTLTALVPALLLTVFKNRAKDDAVVSGLHAAPSRR